VDTLSKLPLLFLLGYTLYLFSSLNFPSFSSKPEGIKEEYTFNSLLCASGKSYLKQQ
jgi:hypothetical protein